MSPDNFIKSPNIASLRPLQAMLQLLQVMVHPFRSTMRT